MLNQIILHRYNLLIPIFLLFILSTSVLSSLKVTAANNSCKDLIVLFVRGSGDDLNDDEFNSLKSNLGVVLDGSLDYEVLEINESTDGILKYLASPVSGSLDALVNTVGAKISSLSIGKYNISKNSGIDVLFQYLENSSSISNCPGTKLVFSGYSQGAQVIGEALDDSRMNSFADRIIYTALFGDPKYSSEEKKYEPWARGSALPGTLGSLGPRLPYLSGGNIYKTGSWCDKDDVVCASNYTRLIVGGDTHGNYGDKYIPESVKEMASVISSYFATKGIVVRPACGTAKLDIVLSLDISTSMRSTSGIFSGNNPKRFSESLFQSGCNVRVAVVGYGAHNQPPAPLLNFTSSPTNLQTYLENLNLAQENLTDTFVKQNDGREALSLSLDMLWRNDAEKTILTITNTTGTGWPENQPNLETAMDVFSKDSLSKQIIEKSRNLGGIEIYAVQAPDTSNSLTYENQLGAYSYYAPFYLATGGNPLFGKSCSGICYWYPESLIGFAGEPNSKPSSYVSTIRAKAGEAVKVTSVDVSGDVIIQAKNTGNMGYEWYVDCDNMHKKMQLTETLEMNFSSPQSCTGSLVTTVHRNYCYFSCPGPFGGIRYSKSTATFHLEILPANYTEPTLPGPITELKKTRYEDHLTITWQPPINSGNMGETAYLIRDQDGNILGVSRQTTLHITDLPEDTVEPVVTITTASTNGTSKDLISSASVATEVSGETLASTSQRQSIQQIYNLSDEQIENRPLNPITSLGNFSTTIQQLNSAPNGQRRLDLVNPKPTSPVSNWLQFSIIAVPVALLLALGIIARPVGLFSFKK